MTTYTITTAQNIDELTGKAGADTYNVNGGYLTVDQDSRYGHNQNTSAALGTISLSSTLGGTIEFNAEDVRIIPYDGGSGNVPVSNTAITGASGTGLLIGVYSALNVAPTAAGAAMPASGWIKIKQWNGAAYIDNEALGGLTATVNGTDRVGWIEIVGVDALAVGCNRLNLFKVRGEWFDLGTTDGNRATTYQIPSNGAIVYLPGVWVETAASSGVYEFYPCAGSATAEAATIATDEVRGRWCWISTAGLLRFGHDGTNSTGGFIPESGRKIRIPNIFFMCCTAAAPTVNVLPNATLATRYEFATTGGGVLDIDKACFNWYLNLGQPFSVALSNVGVLTTIVMSECASPLTWSHVGIGHEAAVSTTGLSISQCFAGGTMTDCVWTRAAYSAGQFGQSMTDLVGFACTRVRFHHLGGNRAAGGAAVALTRVANSTWEDCTVGGGRTLVSGCADCTFTDTIYYDHPATTTPTTNAVYAFDLTGSTRRVTIDGVSFGGLTLCQPYSGIMTLAALGGCTEIKLRNIGTYAAPLDLGDAQRDDVAWTRTTTTATVTAVAHGLKVNDIIWVLISSSTAAITVAAKTIASTPTADTFTFTCLNAGDTSGTLTYYPTMAAVLFDLGGNAAASDVAVQRCYTNHTRSNLFTADNSSKGVLIENVYSAFVRVPLTPMLNGRIKGIGADPSLAAQIACYGTHWLDCFDRPITANVAGVAWTRATTTATVTSVAHGLITGTLINVTVTSDAGAIVLGQKTITVTGVDTFTFACLNAGSASGTLTMVPLTSRIAILMNEATTDTASIYSFDAGAPAFTAAGSLSMPTVGDQVTFTMTESVIGHTGFPIAEAVMAGGTIGNYDLTYAIDKNDGDGFSAFKNLAYPRAGGGGSNGSTTVTMTDTTGVAAGDYVWGTNIAPNAKVVSVDSSTDITVDLANVGTVSGVLRFNQLPSETGIDAQLGFKLKIRVLTSTTNAQAITSVYVFTASTESSRAYQYPLDLATLTITGLKNPSEVRLFDAGTTNEIQDTGQESVTSGTFSAEIDVSEYPSVDIAILSLGYQNTRLLGLAVPAEGLTIPIQQALDRQYANP